MPSYVMTSARNYELCQNDLLTYYLILNSERSVECIDFIMIKNKKIIRNNGHFYAKSVMHLYTNINNIISQYFSIFKIMSVTNIIYEHNYCSIYMIIDGIHITIKLFDFIITMIKYCVGTRSFNDSSNKKIPSGFLGSSKTFVVLIC